MKVKDFIKWLEKQNQDLEVSVVEYCEYEDWCYNGEDEVLTSIATTQAVCFDDPPLQSRTTDYSLILGVEK